jgi:hypothetical protein
MTDTLRGFEKLTGRARLEDVPPVDVSRRVIRRLSHAPQPSTWPWSLMAATSVAAAILVVALTLPTYQTITNPLNAAFIAAIDLMP